MFKNTFLIILIITMNFFFDSLLILKKETQILSSEIIEFQTDFLITPNKRKGSGMR